MKAIKRQNLTDMLNYCENVSKCRRKMLVEHFGEVKIFRIIIFERFFFKDL